ncbi:hypothetical protein PMI42_06146 [Bradyrhizobium sp. YR681]|uniref:hypothetical protein n=1 Tax=Bradyrhizobium sp. YR681 TaxID=1144344 RepID=UPI00026FA8CA|nr:hypothetical protein [Bradyrhizobium sp. YR681]EJN10549.1 hypothetical protein PMI42_06146 [Bradyrhizobium sp. YR681]
MAQKKWPSLRYYELARAIAPSTGVKRYFVLVYQNEAYSKLAESSMAASPAQIAWLGGGSSKF